MTIPLGPVNLSDHLYLDGLVNSPVVALSEPLRLLGGSAVTQIGPALSGGRPLALISDNHITHAQVAELEAIEGTVVTLTHPTGSYTVIVASLDLEPDELLANPDSAPTLYYSGTINLIEV